MQRYKVTARADVEMVAEVWAEGPPSDLLCEARRVLTLHTGETRDDISAVNRLRECANGHRIEIVPHPEWIGDSVHVGEVLDLERIA